MPVLNYYSQTKMAKGEAFGYKTAILHLAPFTLSGKNVCPKASKECAAACLNTSGRGQMNSVQAARVNKTNAFWQDRLKILKEYPLIGVANKNFRHECHNKKYFDEGIKLTKLR